MKKVNIKKIVERLKKCKVEKVILFGSWAKGKANKYSDIDLLIIKKTRKNPYRRIPEIRKHLFDIDSAFDILVMTPKEVEHRLSLGDFFIEEIIKKGKVIYEAKNNKRLVDKLEMKK